MANLFGFQITRAPKEQGDQPTFVLPEPETGATTTAGFYSEFLDIEGQTKNEYDLIRKYRSTAEHPECDLAIEDIVNESVNTEELKDTVSILTDKVPYSTKIKNRVKYEFEQIVKASMNPSPPPKISLNLRPCRGELPPLTLQGVYFSPSKCLPSLNEMHIK